MMCLDIFVNSLSTKDYNTIKPNLNQLNNTTINIASTDIYLPYFNSLSNTPNTFKDIDVLNKLGENFEWQNNINAILNDNIFESLVITDTTKKIVWVNDGFSKMTGYSKKYALNKKPIFLQGKNTLESSKNNIREKLNSEKPFKEIVLNYKKDKSTYKCELYIFPLYNKKNKVTHYLALEKKVA